MRLINVHTLCVEPINLSWDPSTQSYKPAYAILSHTWLDGEVTFDDLSPGDRSFPAAARDKRGWAKITKSCEQARLDGLDHVWVDTCCIDKSSSAELSEAINSMFRWYRHAAVCYSFLSDVAPPQRGAATRDVLAGSRWFTRGWTLQELVAPRVQNFYDAAWNPLGTKEDLVEVIAEITSIPPLALVEASATSLAQFTVAQKMSWAARRVTTREEDISYCLLGIFDINLPLLYGEGGERAFLRLQEEIARRYDDDSIFAWRVDEDGHGRGGGLLATSPACFKGCESILTLPADPFADFLCGFQLQFSPVQVTNRGWKVHRMMWQDGYWLLMPLRCWDAKRQPGPGQSIVSITLSGHEAAATTLAQAEPDQYVRLDWMAVAVADLLEKRLGEERELFLLPSHPATQAVAGLGWLRTAREVWIRSLPDGCTMHSIGSSAPDRVTMSTKTRLVKGLDEGQWAAFTLRCSTGPLPTPTGLTPVSAALPTSDLYVALFVFSRSSAERPLHALASGPDPASAFTEGHARLVAAATNPGQQDRAMCDGPNNTSMHALLDAGEKAAGGGDGGGDGGKRYIIDVFSMGNNKSAKVWDGSPVVDTDSGDALEPSASLPPSHAASMSLKPSDERAASMGGLAVVAAATMPGGRGRTRDRSRVGRVGTGFGSGFGFDIGRSWSRVGSSENLFAAGAGGYDRAGSFDGQPPVGLLLHGVDSLPMRPRIGSSAGSLWRRRRRRPSASASVSPTRVVVVDHDEEVERQEREGDDDDNEWDDEGGDEGDDDYEDEDEDDMSPRGRQN